MTSKPFITEDKLRELEEQSSAEAKARIIRNIEAARSFFQHTLLLPYLTSGDGTENDRSVIEAADDNLRFSLKSLERSLLEIEATNFHVYARLIGTLDLIVSGLATGYNRASLSKSAKLSVKRKNTEAGRKAALRNKNMRDIVLTKELGPLVEQGLKGEDLRMALLEAFARAKIDPKNAKPGLRSVQNWSADYWAGRKWRAKAKT